MYDFNLPPPPPRIVFSLLLRRIEFVLDHRKKLRVVNANKYYCIRRDRISNGNRPTVAAVALFPNPAPASTHVAVFLLDEFQKRRHVRSAEMVYRFQSGEHAHLAQSLEMVFANVLWAKRKPLVVNNFNAVRAHCTRARTLYAVLSPTWWSANRTCGRTGL